MPRKFGIIFMDFIEQIKQSETEAEYTIAEARKEAQRIIEEAKNRQHESIAIEQDRLSALRSEALQNQKPKLKELYKNILADGATQALKLEQQAKQHSKKAVDFLISKL